MKKFAFAVLALAILVVGMAMAEDPIPAVPETQGISTSTAVVCLGTVTETQSVTWTTSTADIRDNPPLDPWYNAFVGVETEGAILFAWENSTPERVSTTSYSDTILADNGYVELNKLSTADTGNKQANQNNLKTQKQLDFVSFADSMGRATTAESLLVDSISMGSQASERFMCPWAEPAGDAIPPYCNIIEMGSTFSGSQVSMVTSASERTIAKAADIPVAVDYSVGLSGTGSASAYIRAHIQEGRYKDTVTNIAGVFTPVVGFLAIEQYPEFDQSVDLSYSEKTTASGTIEAFSKSMSYQSGVRRF